MSSDPLTLSSKIDAAEALKLEGNDLFVAGDYQGALSKYIRMTLYLHGLQGNDQTEQMRSMLNLPSNEGKEVTNDQQKLIKQGLIACYLNIAACNLKLERFERAVEYAGKVCLFVCMRIADVFLSLFYMVMSCRFCILMRLMRKRYFGADKRTTSCGMLNLR